MFNDLERAVRRLATDPALRVILITGAGDRAFAAGADIRGLAATDASSGLAISLRGQQVFNLIERCGKPTIACINGAALGGGLELALACSLRLASTTARLGLPEATLGLLPGYGGTQRLPRLIGRAAALKMMLTAAVIDASEALHLGLVNEVLPPADLLPRACALAETIASLAPQAIAAILQATEPTGPDTGFRREASLFGHLCGTADKHEGLQAFLEKRKPTWTGK
jgi:enoyl-CoA hydratase